MSDQELDALRRAWSDIPAPAPFRDLAEEDADTQRAVAWLRTAWQTAAPRQVPVMRAARPRRLPRWIAIAAAAGLLAVLGRNGFRTEPIPHAAPGALPPAPSIEVLASSRDRVELRSGAVRLTWLHPTPSAPLTTTPEQP